MVSGAHPEPGLDVGTGWAEVVGEVGEPSDKDVACGALGTARNGDIWLSKPF